MKVIMKFLKQFHGTKTSLQIIGVSKMLHGTLSFFIFGRATAGSDDSVKQTESVNVDKTIK
jgi:hypothetical protein